MSIIDVNMRMSRVFSRIATGFIFTIALLFLWEVYYHVSVSEGENPDPPLHVLQVRQNIIVPHQSNVKKETMEEKEKRKSSDLDFIKEQQEIQRHRKRGLHYACSGVPPNDDIPQYTKKHVFVIDQHKLAYCFIPKVGCSNWKRIMMVLNGERDSVEGLTSDEVHRMAKLKFFDEYDNDEQALIVKNYSWFFVVREPFKRALSVYRNKFESYENFRNNPYFHRFGKEIIKKWRLNPSGDAVATGANVTWPEFADYLTHPAERARVEKDWHFSDHWREMYKICSPCTIDYDFIGKLETIDTDAKYFLKTWGVEDKVSYLSSLTSKPTNSSSSATYDKYFGQLSKEDLTRLWDLYKLDYELFDYPRPDVVP